MKTQIKFGTDGWRARIADEFTFENVRRVALAAAEYFKSHPLAQNGIAIGYDNRFQSEDFAQTAAKVCAAAGLKTFLTAYSVASPVISFYVKKHQLCGGIMITASHNPPEWNGLKIKEDFGGSARPEVTKKVEELLASIEGEKSIFRLQGAEMITPISPKKEYLDYLAKFVDGQKIAQANLRIVVDPMHGSGAHYIREVMAQYGMQIEEIEANRDPAFAGFNPEPLSINLVELTSIAPQFDCGLALDGDGDRISAVDATGTFINTQQVFSLLLKHLAENRKMSGMVIKTFNLSRLIEKQAKKYGFELREVPIGFKHIADLMIKGGVLLGGEESGGYGILGGLPERDGSLCGLLLMELMAYEKKTLKQIMDGIMAELGAYAYRRADLHIARENAVGAIHELPLLKKLAGHQVVKVETLDGTKLNFENESWILFRLSGTEPLLRIYCEGRDQSEVDLLLGAGQKLFI